MKYNKTRMPGSLTIPSFSSFRSLLVTRTRSRDQRRATLAVKVAVLIGNLQGLGFRAFGGYRK